MMLIDEIDYKTRMMAMLETPTEIEQAYRLCEEVFVQYGLNRRLYTLNDYYLSVILNYLNVRTSIYLNMNDFKRAWEPILLFEHYANGRVYLANLEAIHRNLKASLLARQGNLEEARNVLTDALELSCTKDIRQRLLYTLGGIETSLTGPDYRINSLCEALGEAEEAKDEERICLCYREIARMFSKLGQAATGLSLLQKAEQYYLLHQKDYELMTTRMYLAMSYLSIFNTAKYMQQLGEENMERFNKQAKAYIDMVDVDKLVLESDQAFYYRTYGLVYVDMTSIEKALTFYQRVNAYRDIKDCEGYINTIRNLQSQPMHQS